MGFGSFDRANMAVVAYAHVATDGSSTTCNSGVTTSKVGTGHYSIVLPSDLAQESDRVFVLVTPLNNGPVVWFVATVTVTQYDVYFVLINDAPHDCEFQVTFLRTIVPPPAGAPA